MNQKQVSVKLVFLLVARYHRYLDSFYRIFGKLIPKKQYRMNKPPWPLLTSKLNETKIV